MIARQQVDTVARLLLLQPLCTVHRMLQAAAAAVVRDPAWQCCPITLRVMVGTSPATPQPIYHDHLRLAPAGVRRRGAHVAAAGNAQWRRLRGRLRHRRPAAGPPAGRFSQEAKVRRHEAPDCSLARADTHCTAVSGPPHADIFGNHRISIPAHHGSGTRAGPQARLPCTLQHWGLFEILNVPKLI